MSRKRNLLNWLVTSNKKQKSISEESENSTASSSELSENVSAAQSLIQDQDKWEDKEDADLDESYAEYAVSAASDSDNSEYDDDQSEDGCASLSFADESSATNYSLVDNQVLKTVVGPQDIAQSITTGPVQTKLSKYPQKKFGNKWRGFKMSWFHHHKWLEYSILDDSAFCFPCRFLSNAAYEPNKPFVTVGFKNWKRAMEKDSGFLKHAASDQHKRCEVAWNDFSIRCKNNESVLSQINKMHQKQVQENREYLQLIAEVLLFAAVQGFPLRGDNESETSVNRGNFIELLHFVSKHNLFLQSRLLNAPKNAKYLHHSIQNELLNIISNLILNEISNDIKRCEYFAIMVDGTKDISETEQISIVLRYYLNGTLYERFLGYTAAELFSAQSLFLYIK